MATSSAALIAEIQRETQAAMSQARTKSEADTKTEVQSFYSQGSPALYQRTGALGNSVSASGGGMQFTIQLIPHAYAVPNPLFDHDGTGRWSHFSGIEVLNAAENSTSGVLGKGGFWQRSEQKIEQDIKDAMHSHGFH